MEQQHKIQNQIKSGAFPIINEDDQSSPPKSVARSDQRMIQFGGVSSQQLSREDTSSMEDENHSCQDEELVINTLMTEPEFSEIHNPTDHGR